MICLKTSDMVFITIIIIMSRWEHGFPLTHSRHPSLSSIAPGRSSRPHPGSAQSCCRYVLAGRPTLAHPCEGVNRSTSLLSSPLLLQQCPACLIRLIWIVFVKGGRWPYSCCICGVVPPGLVQSSSKHSCIIAVKHWLHTLN